MALLARRLGRSVALLERGTHPRFAIGESSSPLANLLLETLSDRYGLPRIRPLSPWGTWQPRVSRDRLRPEARLHLLRARRRAAVRRPAGPRERAPRRGEPARRGRGHALVPAGLRPLPRPGGGGSGRAVPRSHGDRAGRRAGWPDVPLGRSRRRPVTISARLVVDAPGPRGFLSRALGIGEESFDGLPRTEALYTHFRESAGWTSRPGSRRRESRRIRSTTPPSTTSFRRAGSGSSGSATGSRARASRPTGGSRAELGFQEGAPAWDRLLERFRRVAEQFARAPARSCPSSTGHALSVSERAAGGPGWILLPSAAAFVDPLLSTGFPLTLLGIERLARALEEDWGSPRLRRATRQVRRSAHALRGRHGRAFSSAALYATFADFPVFAALAELYFAAASYSGKSENVAVQRTTRRPTVLGVHDVLPVARANLRDSQSSSRAPREPLDPEEA